MPIDLVRPPVTTSSGDMLTHYAAVAPTRRSRARCATTRLHTYPCAYELTAHINPRSEHAVRQGGVIRMVARATDLPPTRHGWHHGARQGCEKAPRRTNPRTPPRPRHCASARFHPQNPCHAPISGVACAISPGNPSLSRRSRPSSPPAPPRRALGVTGERWAQRHSQERK